MAARKNLLTALLFAAAATAGLAGPHLADPGWAQASDPKASTTEPSNTNTNSAAQAQLMLAQVVRELKTNPSMALAEFNSPTGAFRKGELYVLCFDMRTGDITAHTDRWLLGTKITGSQPYGAAGAKIFAAAQAGRTTRVSYDFPRPGGTESVPMVSYVTRVGNEGCGVGYYPNPTEARAH